MNPVKPIKIDIVWIKLENLYKTELWKDTEKFHTYKFDMIGYMNNFWTTKVTKFQTRVDRNFKQTTFVKLV